MEDTRLKTLFADMFEPGGKSHTTAFTDECYMHYFYCVALPLDTKIIHDEVGLQASLHVISPEMGRESILSFYERGIAKIETRSKNIFSYPDNKIKGGWFDRATSEKLYHEFLRLNTEDWRKSYVPTVQFTDGDHWELNIKTKDGIETRYSGYDAGPTNWADVQRLFNTFAKLRLFFD